MSRLASGTFISCNFSSFPPIPRLLSLKSQNPAPRIFSLRLASRATQFRKFAPNLSLKTPFTRIINISVKKGFLQICHSTSETQNSGKADGSGNRAGGGSRGGEGRNWTTSFLLFVLWAALVYYVFNLTPNQTPSRDMYFLQKLLNLKGDDGFRMNEVLVSLWYIMGLWPLVYSMLLLPTGRSSKSNVPVWPFLVLSCFGGAYALLPYFVLWRPPLPAIEETELKRWPLNFLESKVTAWISIAAGFGIMVYAGLADGDVWREFYQYFRESKFIHITCIDFTLLSAFAPFWVYNDMTARKWFQQGSWLLPLSLIPFLGPSLYLVLRPSLSTPPISVVPTTTEQE